MKGLTATLHEEAILFLLEKGQRAMNYGMTAAVALWTAAGAMALANQVMKFLAERRRQKTSLKCDNLWCFAPADVILTFDDEVEAWCSRHYDELPQETEHDGDREEERDD